MSDEQLNIQDARAFSAGHTMGRIPYFQTFEIMDHELDTLSEATDDEMINLGFFTCAVGVLVSCLIAWTTTELLGEVGRAILLAVTLVSVFVAAFCGIKWSFARGKRRSVIDKIRTRSVFIEQNRDGSYRFVPSIGRNQLN